MARHVQRDPNFWDRPPVQRATRAVGWTLFAAAAVVLTIGLTLAVIFGVAFAMS